MLWINYLDTGSERVHTSLEGSLRMEGCRDGGEERRGGGSGGGGGVVARKNSPASVSLQPERQKKSKTTHDYYSGISSTRC